MRKEQHSSESVTGDLLAGEDLRETQPPAQRGKRQDVWPGHKG